MGNPAGVKLDFEALDKRRLKAISLLEKSDWNQSEVARPLKGMPPDREPVGRPVPSRRPGSSQKAARAGQARVDGGGWATSAAMVMAGAGEAGL